MLRWKADRCPKLPRVRHETPAPGEDRRHARTRLERREDDRGAGARRRRRLPHQHEPRQPRSPASRPSQRSATSRSSCSHPLGILVDLQGPKLRVGTFAGGSVQLAAGATFTLDSSNDARHRRARLPAPSRDHRVRVGRRPPAARRRQAAAQGDHASAAASIETEVDLRRQAQRQEGRQPARYAAADRRADREGPRRPARRRSRTRPTGSR